MLAVIVLPGFLGGSVVQNLPANAGDVGSIPQADHRVHCLFFLDTQFGLCFPGSQV